MVTFRFYVVTTVALFLALAIGIVVGSALDERLVSGLESQVERVQGNLDDTIELIDAKNREIDDLRTYVDESAPFAVDGQLPDTTVLVVAEEGLDSGPVEDLVRRARQAGAHADGIVWLDPRWKLDELADRQELTTALELDGGSAVTVRTSAWNTTVTAVAELSGATLGPVDDEGVTDTTETTDAVDGDTTEPLDPETTIDAPTTTVDPASADDDTSATTAAPPEPIDTFALPTLAALDEAGFARLQRVDGDGPVAGTDLAIVFVTGPTSRFDPPAAVLGELSKMSADLGIPTVVAEIYEVADDDDGEQGERGATLDPWRSAEEAQVSTVDDLDLVAGRVAAVLALAQLRADGVSGHYGYGGDATRVLPEWPGP